jgi:hypothetical protein
MTIPGHVQDYLKKCRWEKSPFLNSGSDSLANIKQVVVIPAFAEKHCLFATLATLAGNDSSELERTLVICVINNRPFPHVTHESFKDNSDTLEILRCLVGGQISPVVEGDAAFSEPLLNILQSGLRLAYLDASSAGNEMPLKRGGVGLARKLGMDAGLTVIDYKNSHDGRLLCLDADSPVANNYLSSVSEFYETHNSHAAVVSYAHPFPEEQNLLSAICSYEIFLRYYLLGLVYAESPYAFHTIGSTMTCTVRGYVAVRGMNRREAGEDFYFLNKLAKYCPVGKITATRVYPSARLSSRVPFGTGQRMNECMEGKFRENYFYDPHVFRILKKWLQGMKSCIEEGGNFPLKMAMDISSALADFLEKTNFPIIWKRICATHKTTEKRRRHFQEWFDAFQTMKLIHYLTKAAYPAVSMQHAVSGLNELLLQTDDGQYQYFCDKRIAGISEQIEILKKLRELEPKE